ncbi:hypothetical protein PInf_009727 [Phytophthora infestans]|nr:hypothetical protein PInf_009727 [Phytophthora infestans]
MLMGQVPDLREIVLFGSKCTVFRAPGKRSKKKRACEGVITTRYVQNISTEEKTSNAEPTKTLVSAATENGATELSSAQAPRQLAEPRLSRRKRRKSCRQAEVDGDVAAGNTRPRDP